MKKLITALLLCLFLGMSIDLHQLLKIPVFIHHYLEHIESDKTTSLYSFIKLHYSTNSEHTDNHNDHDNLPFKKTDCSISHFASMFFAPFQPIVSRSNSYIVNNTTQYSRSDYSSAYLNAIWQPPKRN